MISDDALAAHIRDVPDFPEPGIIYKDLTPLLADATAYQGTIDRLVEGVAAVSADLVLAVEARGFIVGAPIAYRLGLGFVPVRKAGKLPWQIEREMYELEYGIDVLEVHVDAIPRGARVLVIDDVLATGGTAAATARLVDKLGGVTVGFGFVLELAFLNGRSKLGDVPIHSLVSYD